MSGYQRAPYSDNPGGGGGYSDNGYGQSYSNNNQQSYGGYQDEPDYHDQSSYGRNQAYPMSSGNPYAASGSGGYGQPKKSKKKWYWIIGIILLLIIIGAVLGGVLGTQLNKKDGDNKSSGDSQGSGKPGNTGLPSGIDNINSDALTATGANGQAYLAVATDSEWMLPVYATGTETAGYSTPTILSSPDPKSAWPSDPDTPSNETLRDHPRLIAPQYKWDALTSGGLIANDPYLKYWNDTIVGNASKTLSDDPVAYTPDGGLDGSGVLDVAREMKMKVKNWAYAFRVTNETKYADRVWLEIQTAAGNTSTSFGDGDTRWNAAHFLDLAEFCNMFAIAYDWLYDHWTDEQRDGMMWSIINLGLNFGIQALDPGQQADFQWWTGVPKNDQEVNGNWNCVCNGGLTLAALAIKDRDPTGTADRILDMTAQNAAQNCFQGAHSDGTWAETANYWYFGTTGAAEMVSALTTATGNDRGLASSNPGWELTSLFHIYVQGQTSLFNYGDCGPNKYSTTANSLLLWGDVFNQPLYSLYQRDHYDAPEPWAMFWYNPAVDGTWWDGLPLDRYFDDPAGAWASARSSWTDLDGSYWAMKSGALKGHQTHGNLDAGDFVIDAMGQRWFGELGSGQYLANQYFTSEDQDAVRWTYYRTRTDGQNTILIDYQNQNVNAQPTDNWGSSNTSQGPAPSFDIPDGSTAFFTQDMSSAYNATVKRGIRYINNRKQILIQDDISGVPSGTDVQWRANTNATVSLNGATATLVLDSSTAIASIVQGPSGAAFSTQSATPLQQDPAVPSASPDPNPPNDGVTVLVIDQPDGGDFTLQVLLNPQWSGMQESDFKTPPNVAIDDWNLNSHDS